ncbi:alpha/beta-hydrolase, partial [Rhodotorula sp. JG-1b]
MLDQLAGRPSPSWRRSQVWLVLLFWLSRFYLSPSRGPRVLWLRRLNRLLARKYTPWQIILATCTLFYAVRHGDVLLGLQAPEPLARLYSSDFYRATWIVTALDAGFATAMSIRWKWLRDIASLAFSGYYLLFANEADEKLRKFRAFCTVEMLRTTWEKQGNPYIRFFTRPDRPRITIRKKLFLPRPKGSKYSKPLTLHLFFAGTEAEVEASHELVMDIPGGGFICMNPLHHEERLLRWAIRTKRVVISFDYGKAPEYPYPFAIDEMYDAYTLLHQTKGRCIGMNRNGEKDLKVLLTGDSAGANIATAMVVKIFEMRGPDSLPLPVALNFAYPALSFHFTSWMPSSDLRVLRTESRSDIASLLLRQKDHLEHRSPLAVVEDVEPARGKRPNFVRRRTTSSGTWPWTSSSGSNSKNRERTLTGSKKLVMSGGATAAAAVAGEEGGAGAAKEGGSKAIAKRKKGNEGEMLGETRLAMTSRTAFFNDRIISPSMCRAMALLYVGPRNAPDLHSDYHLSPIFTPSHLLAQFPPVYMSCGERDPLVDDTVIFAGKLREAKEARKMDILAREARHGDGLRMSTSGKKRDPLLDEDEDDWVRTSIIAGWSHGYLQMVSLLPAAEKVIAMHADWIVEAFETAAAKELGQQQIGLSAPDRNASFSRTHGSSALSDAEDDDDILTFTPKNRRSSSNASRSSKSGGASPPVPPYKTSPPTLSPSADELV